jgi:hypothetical protein
MQVLLTAVQHAAPGRHIGAATGLLTQSRTVGVSLGLAINGAILSLALSAQTRQLAPATAALVPEGLGGLSPHALADLPAERTAEVLSHYSAGFHTMFIWVSGLYLAAALVAVLLPNILIPKRG